MFLSQSMVKIEYFEMITTLIFSVALFLVKIILYRKALINMMFKQKPAIYERRNYIRSQNNVLKNKYIYISVKIDGSSVNLMKEDFLWMIKY